MFKFIARQSFFVNLLAAILLVAFLGFLFFQSLGWITHHGSHLKVPGVLGKNATQAVEILEREGFEVVITDSSYNPDVPMNTVKKQLPNPDATVKVNRTVFLNINPVTLPMVSMPKLEGLSYRFALNQLKKSNLKLGDTTMRADFMKGSVLEQKFNGKIIAPGTKIRWGSPVDLVVGAGLQEIWIPVPDLFGLTVEEAKGVLREKGIVLAATLAVEKIADTARAFVYKQNPEVTNYDGSSASIRPGQTLDIWIQADRPVRAIDTIQTRAPELTLPKGPAEERKYEY